MQIIHKDFKKGIAKVKAENLDDLWYASQLIDPEDLVRGQSYRKIRIGGSEDGQGKAVKKKITITIKVEKAEFSETATQLRVLGTVTEGPEDVPHGSHHTLEVEEGTIFTLIKKAWLKFQIDKLAESASAKTKNIIIAVFDREEAYFAKLKRNSYHLLSSLKGSVQKKRVDVKVKSNFYSEIIKVLEEYNERLEPEIIIAASPAFWRDELLKVLKNHELKKKIITAVCSSVSENAIDEVMKRPEMKEALKQERVSEEMHLVEDLLSQIAKENLGAYGFKEVEEAAYSGAVETLLVTDSKIKSTRETGKYSSLESLMLSVEQGKGHVSIVSSEHDGGKKLDGLGGVGALLRFKLSY